jgi:hypothetical protein
MQVLPANQLIDFLCNGSENGQEVMLSSSHYSESVKTTYRVRSEVLIAVKIPVVVFWVVTPCSDEAGYQSFRGLFCLYLHSTLKMEASRSSETLVSCHITIQSNNPKDCHLHIRCSTRHMW